ncbi:hypothetical protein [Streptomyces sp. WM6386]|uniref:hypothetical protein n=1 Tax=Streptomyces sp. WM6386 TaxID=1415558 RepID=UPI000AB34073|nr:hypothetical protein [Streptomyces sp. WM6386]
MRRRVVVGDGEVQQVAAACARALRGVDAASGEQLGEAALVERAGWLTALVERLAACVVQEHWNGADLAQLASGVDRLGTRLPSQGWMALRRLGWPVTVPEGVYVPDRVVRIAQEQAGRVLRSAWWRAGITAALLAAWPADPARRTGAEWEALRAALPEGEAVADGMLLARTRQIAAFQARHQAAARGIAVVIVPPRGHIEVLPPVPDRIPPPQSPRRPDGGLGLGDLPEPGVRVQHRPGPRRLAADRRPRPDPPAQDQPRPHQQRLRHPHGGRGPGPHQHGPAPDPGPHQERPHSKTPCAREAAQGPRPTR